jgi:hypothetical protein
MLPSGEFSVETTGIVCPVSHRVRYPNVVCGTTVAFSEYAIAVPGSPQALVDNGTGGVSV